jgi:hypothetical protein
MKTAHILLVTACLFPLAAVAGSRSSANYSIAADTADSGGRRATTVAYSNDGSIGGIGGRSTVASPSETARHGYIGQLIDLTNIIVSATPASLNEGSTRQLAARLAYDDGTGAPLAAAAVAWGVVSGPLSGVSAGGAATATNVYQDTAAIVSGRANGQSNILSLLVLNTGIDNFANYAGDGIDDAWQVQYFGLNSLLAGPGLDPDGDGQTNYFEYVATTIPTDGTSKFRLNVAPVPGRPWMDVRFSPVSEKRIYTVVGRPLVETGVFNTVLGNIVDNGTERTLTDTNALGITKFYRVSIEFP